MGNGPASGERNGLDLRPYGTHSYRAFVKQVPGLRENAPKRNAILLIIYIQLLLLVFNVVNLIL